MTSLRDLRRIMDMIDTDVMRLIQLRITHAVQIGRKKRAAQRPLRDVIRERQIMSDAAEISPAILRIYKVIIAESLKAQKADKK